MEELVARFDSGSSSFVCALESVGGRDVNVDNGCDGAKLAILDFSFKVCDGLT